MRDGAHLPPAIPDRENAVPPREAELLLLQLVRVRLDVAEGAATLPLQLLLLKLLLLLLLVASVIGPCTEDATAARRASRANRLERLMLMGDLM